MTPFERRDAPYLIAAAVALVILLAVLAFVYGG